MTVDNPAGACAAGPPAPAPSAHRTVSPRHTTAWLEAGPPDGPLLIFLHGWPQLSVVWRAQLARFAARGWRCVAPDLRGYGGSSAPADPAAYALREVVADMTELHDALGGAPAVWVGHDWGAPVAWSLAGHHPRRCRAVAALCVPYAPQGFALRTLLPYVDRELYPAAEYPDGQWGYYRYHQTHFERAAAELAADPAATVAGLLRPGSPRAVGRRSRSAEVGRGGGWSAGRPAAPAGPPPPGLLAPADLAAVAASCARTGFRGPDAWYVNDAANLAYAAQVPGGGRLDLPVLFVHAAWDPVCDTVHTPLAEPMRAACTDLTEAVVDAGHDVHLERPAELAAALQGWLDRRVGAVAGGPGGAGA